MVEELELSDGDIIELIDSWLKVVGAALDIFFVVLAIVFLLYILI